MNPAAFLSHLRNLLGPLLALLLLVAHTHAANPTVSTRLTKDRITLDDITVLVLTVSDAGKMRLPEFNVPGLQITYRGQSQQFRLDNNGRTQTLQLTFEVRPLAEGTHTIPAIPIETNAGQITTQPLQVSVLPPAPAPQPPNAGQNPPPTGAASADPQQTSSAFAELVLPKKEAYIGEPVEVELRLHVDSRITWDIEHRPVIQGEGFTAEKIPNPQKYNRYRQANGVFYDAAIFRTALSPSRAGTLSIGPAEVPFLAQNPNERPSQGGGLFDMFFGQVLSGGSLRQYRIAAPVVQLEVKPLPVTGRPKSFSGAIGSFELHTQANPLKAAVGDPITMKFVVEGRGNFDRVFAPELIEQKGWRTYPPNTQFQPGNELGTSGSKQFEIAVIPDSPQSMAPLFEFSYFDPEKARYITLTSNPLPLQIEGTSPAQTSTSGATPSTAANSQPPQPPPATVPNDIHGILYDPLPPTASLQPLYNSRAFLLAQFLPSAALGAWVLTRCCRPNNSTNRSKHLQTQKRRLLSALATEQNRTAFFQGAVDFARTHFALASGRDPLTFDLGPLRDDSSLPPQKRQALADLLNTHAELAYAGHSQTGRTATLSEQEREKILALLTTIESPHGNS